MQRTCCAWLLPGPGRKWLGNPCWKTIGQCRVSVSRSREHGARRAVGRIPPDDHVLVVFGAAHSGTAAVAARLEGGSIVPSQGQRRTGDPRPQASGRPFWE